MIKVTAPYLAAHVGVSKQAVAQWFSNNKRSLNNIEDVADYILMYRIRK